MEKAQIRQEIEEHLAVLNTLKQVNQERRCMRLVGGVLIEKNVPSVIKELENTLSNLEKLK